MILWLPACCSLETSVTREYCMVRKSVRASGNKMKLFAVPPAEKQELFVHLRVGTRRFYGPWEKVRGCSPHGLFRKRRPNNFYVKLPDVTFSGRPHNFRPVLFSVDTKFQCVDTTLPAAEKAVFSYTASIMSATDEHVALLVFTLLGEGHCAECTA